MLLLELTAERLTDLHCACLTFNIVKKLKTIFSFTIYKCSYKKKIILKIPTQAPSTHLVNNANNTQAEFFEL